MNSRDNSARDSSTLQSLKGIIADKICEIPEINTEADRYSRYMLEEYQSLLPSDPFDPNDGSPLSTFYWECYAFRTKELVILALAEL